MGVYGLSNVPSKQNNNKKKRDAWVAQSIKRLLRLRS